MKQTLIALAVFACAQVMSAQRGNITGIVYEPSQGEDLVQLCRIANIDPERRTDPQSVDLLSCMYYLSGVNNAALMVDRGESVRFPVCIPPGVSTIQLAKVVVHYGDMHPEKLHFGSAFFVRNAWQEAFPCKK